MPVMTKENCVNQKSVHRFSKLKVSRTEPRQQVGQVLKLLKRLEKPDKSESKIEIEASNGSSSH